MILTFKKALELTDTISTRAAYQIDALKGLWLAASALPRRALIVEIGLQYGRSSSLLLQVARERDLRYVGIDPFNEGTPLPDKGEPLPRWLEMAAKVGHPFTLCVGTSQDYAGHRGGQDIGLLHIDGDHDENSVTQDLCWWIARLMTDAVICFHDYDGPVTPGVKIVADSFCKMEYWERVGVYGTLAVFRKP